MTNTKLAFYKERPDTIDMFIRQLLKSINSAFDVESIQIDTVLFHLSSCQKVNSENWGRLYSFMIAEVPTRPEVSL